MSSGEQATFVVDGDERARTAMAGQVRDEVESAYAEQLVSASWLRKWMLRREMKRELRRRLKKCAPPDALY